MFFTIDYQNFVSVTISFDLILNRSFFFFLFLQISFVIVVDQQSVNGGSLTLALDATNLGSGGGQLQVQNNPASPGGDSYFWNNGKGLFQWTWSPGNNAGVAISPLPIAGNIQSTCFSPVVNSYSNLNTWQVISWDANTGKKKNSENLY